MRETLPKSKPLIVFITNHVESTQFSDIKALKRNIKFIYSSMEKKMSLSTLTRAQKENKTPL